MSGLEGRSPVRPTGPQTGSPESQMLSPVRVPPGGGAPSRQCPLNMGSQPQLSPCWATLAPDLPSRKPQRHEKVEVLVTRRGARNNA